jgi:hypothetical protein
MAKPPRPWTVTPHGPIQRIDDNLWWVESPVPGIPGRNFPRSMHIIRRSDGSLLLHNAIPLDDAGLEALTALGRPAILVLPSHFHCIDAHAMRARLSLKTYCPAGSLAETRQRVEIDGTLDALPPDPAVRFVALAGTKFGEGVLAVTSTDAEHVSLVLCDVVLNIPHLPGFWGLIWRLFGFTGDPRCGPLWLKHGVIDRGALRGTMKELAAIPHLTRLVPSHGLVMDQDPAGILRSLAARI